MFTEWKISHSKDVNYSGIVNSYQTPGNIFCRYTQGNSKFMWKVKRARISKTIYYKKKKLGGLPQPSLVQVLQCSTVKRTDP